MHEKCNKNQTKVVYNLLNVKIIKKLMICGNKIDSSQYDSRELYFYSSHI